MNKYFIFLLGVGLLGLIAFVVTQFPTSSSPQERTKNDNSDVHYKSKCGVEVTLPNDWKMGADGAHFNSTVNADFGFEILCGDNMQYDIPNDKGVKFEVNIPGVAIYKKLQPEALEVEGWPVAYSFENAKEKILFFLLTDNAQKMDEYLKDQRFQIIP